MPVVFRYKGVRFFFYSNEGSPREPGERWLSCLRTIAS
jgi:hypothetical protein